VDVYSGFFWLGMRCVRYIAALVRCFQFGTFDAIRDRSKELVVALADGPLLKRIRRLE